MIDMGKDARHGTPRVTTVLPLADIPVEIEWQASPPPDDALARLLLELLGEEGLKEVFYE
jgi:hypothetical protein